MVAFDTVGQGLEGGNFSEKISTRVKVRPKFAKAMEYARTIKTAVPLQRDEVERTRCEMSEGVPGDQIETGGIQAPIGCCDVDDRGKVLHGCGAATVSEFQGVGAVAAAEVENAQPR